MKLLKVQKSRNPEKIYLIFKGRPPLPFFLDDYVKEKIKLGLEIDNDYFSKLSYLSLTFLLRSYGLNRLATSPHIKSTLLPKLRRQSIIYQKRWLLKIDSQEIINNLLNYFENHELLDTASFAASLIHRHQKKSHSYLRSLFLHHRLDLSLLPLPQGEVDKIKKLLEKKIRNLSKPLDFKTKNRLFGFLLRKGFAYDDIKTVIDELLNLR
jgi:SOS response regulatory protein OraA/RecX